MKINPLTAAYRRLSIRTQLVLLLMGAAVLPAAAGLAWFVAQQRQQASDAAYAQVRLVAASMGSRIRALLRDSEALLAQLAARPAVRALDARRCDPLFEEYLLLRREATVLVLRDAQGRLICNSSSNVNPVATGQMVQLSWFREGIAAGRFAVSNAYKGNSSGRWTVNLTYPVHDKAGRVAGLLILGIDLMKLQARLTEDTPPNAHLAVFDRNYTFLLRSIDPEKSIGTPLPEKQLAYIKDRNEAYFAARNILGVSQLWALQTIPDIGWRVTIGLPEDDVFAAQREDLGRSAAVGSGIVLLLLVLAWLVSKPMRELARASAQLVGGAPSARAAVQGPAEVQAMAAHFNRLLDERERNLQTLRLSEERFALATRGSSDGFWDWNVVTGDDYFSERFCELIGYRRDELVPHVDTWRDLLHPDDIEPTWRAVQAHLEQREPYDIEIRMRTKAGGYRQFRARGQAVWNEAGVAVRMAGSIVDITERKRAEDALNALNAELEGRVRARTAELEATNRELGTFTYTVSHDLKAPLRGIVGYSRLLMDDHAGQLDAEGREFLANVRTAALQMNQLIDDLLAYSRLERREIRAARVELRGLVDEVLQERAEDLRARRAALKLALLEGTVLHCDRDGLAMALRNLLENALKFSRPAQTPEIEIGVRESDRAWQLWIRDNGIGFDMQYHDRIFQIFQRLHRSEEFPGTGVGLAIVKKAMERMGGRVWAQSSLGAGTTFFLEIPR